MKKVLLLATAFLFVTGVAVADKGKKKKCAKGKTCCTKDAKAEAGKACCKDKDKSTAKM
ncbi:MAG: hypothetical protein IPL84_15720 [Chitinophagaceae bacterium]|nr:hypothetical protein [Chitinophagaceae bacterium]